MSDANASGAETPRGLQDTSFFGHPKGLAILFLTEMWERFSYYGMRGLLVFYLAQHFLFSQQQAGLIYGAYTALVYVMTIVGGTLADRYLGQRKAVTFGAILLVLGHSLMAFEGAGSREYLEFEGERIEIEAEGRGGDRELFVTVDGDTRRLILDTERFAVVGGEDRWIASEEANDAGYIIERESRSLIEQACALVGAGCAGPQPVDRVTYLDGRSYALSQTDDGVFVEVDGTLMSFEEGSLTDAVILQTADEDSAERVRYAAGSWATTVEQQQFFVNILFLALALIIAGVGYLKANISTIVGELYELGDPRRDSGFTLFYMGINLGSLLSSLTVGWIGIAYGWKWGFGLAGIGMLAGLVTFLMFQHWLEGKAEPPNPAKLKEKILGLITVETACYLVGLVIIAVAFTAVTFPSYFGGVVGWLGLAMIVVFLGYALLGAKGEEKGQMVAALYFILAQIPFWALFEQAGSSLNLFTGELVNKEILGVSVPAPVFQALNAGYIIIFAPILAWLWIALAKRKLNPSTPVKFALGVFLAGLGFYVLVAGINLSGTALVAVYFVFLIYLIHTLGELMLSPVGLSAITKLAPARVVGMAMGAWFLFSGLSNYVAGLIASTTGGETIGGQIVDPVAAKAGYAQVYGSVGLVAMGIALVMLLISPIIKKLMGSAAREMEPHPTETEAGGPSMDRSSDAP
jgi:POT family proton-dependent oligopeptide transporter